MASLPDDDHVGTIEDYVDNFSYVPWLEYLNKLTSSTDPIVQSELLLTSSASYLSELGKVLEETPKRVLANYAMTRVVTGLVPYLRNREIRNIVDKYRPSLPKCEVRLRKEFSELIGAMYFEKSMTEDARALAFEVMSGVRGALVRELEQVRG